MITEEGLHKYELAEQEYANSYIGIRELSKKYNLDRGKLSGWLLAKGFLNENRRAKKSFDVDYFDSIDTEEKSYWLGFLFADGAITQYKHSYDIELSLKIDDHKHVEKFAKCVNKEYVNNNSTYRSRCILGSKHMFDILNSYGCTTKKSLTLKFPKINIFKDKNLIRHFIRGYVDGDGCLSYCNKQHTNICVSILGTKDFLDGIQREYSSNHKYSKNNKLQDTTLVLSYSCKSGFIFTKWLYENSTIYLDRKYKKFLEYCRLYQK